MLGGWRKNRKCACKAACATPLCDAPAGKPLRVASIAGERNLCARMASLGIYPGVEMERLCEGCGSPCVIRVHGGTISLSSGISQKILVDEASI